MPTLVFGYDRSGRAFMEQAQTLDISIAGARLTGLSSEVAPGFILAVQQGDRRARFQVLWVGEPNTDLEGHIGLQCVEVGGHTRKRILCIEANPSEQALQRSYLETAGYELVCRADWRQGMAVFQESAFDLLMVDVQSGHDGPRSSSTSCGRIRPAPGSCCSVIIRDEFPKLCSTRPTDSSTNPIPGTSC